MNISELWYSSSSSAWEQALQRYWHFVKERNVELERALNALDLKRLQRFTAQEWYDFLRDEYFRWKYTADNRYATTTSQVRKYVEANELSELDSIRKKLLILNPSDIRLGLSTATEIKGLGIAGASGLTFIDVPRALRNGRSICCRCIGAGREPTRGELHIENESKEQEGRAETIAPT